MMAPLRLSARVGFVALALLAAGFPGSAVAAGGGGDGSSRRQAKPEDPQYSVAVTAIKAGDYAKAIPLLQGVV